LSEPVLIWTQFAACATLITAAGATLSRNGDVIADKTGLSGGWIGLVLLATVTSLPELVTGLSAVTVAGVPNIAVGDALGSCVFNLAILVVLDFSYRKESVYSRASQGHVLSAAFGAVLIGFVAFNLLLAGKAASWNLAHVGGYTPIIVALYFIAMRAIFVYERRNLERFAEEMADRYPHISLAQALRRYSAAAAVVVGAGIWLPAIGKDLAHAMEWGDTFVGTQFIAAATSLPELVVTISALRIGALDMAIANLLGSNLFNMLIVAVDDLAYTRGSLLVDVSPMHAVTAVSAVIMTGLATVGLLYRPAGRLFRTVGWVSLGLFTVYLLNSYVLYLHRE
jgi:cation:H+ antiporter